MMDLKAGQPDHPPGRIPYRTPSTPTPAHAQTASTTPDSRRRLLTWTLTIFLGSLLLVFARSMHADLDVDEHPFITSAALLARRGALPYRDYHYNHMPTEVIVYAGLFRLFPYLLLAARSFQVVCAAGAATVFFYVAYSSFKNVSERVRLILASGAALLLLTHPLFVKTAGLCWNHDFPMLMALLAFLALRRGLGGSHPSAFVALSGFLLALSVTTRLTFATAGLGFVILLVFYPALTPRRKAMLLVVFAAGFILASLPTIWVWAQAPRNAFFGNFRYPKLNTEIHALRDEHKRFTFFPILAYYLRNLLFLPANGIVTLAFVTLFVMAFSRRAVLGPRRMVELVALLTIVVCLTGSAFMPAPPYPQYFYAAVPFMILGLLLCLASMPDLLHRPAVRRLMAAGLGVSIAFSAGLYRGLAFLPLPSHWVPLQAHSVGLEVARKAHVKRVLTLDADFPLEGGLDVDERLTTGRFGLRAASLLSPAERAQYLMPTPEDLPAILRERPAAVLVHHGTDWRIARALRNAARSLNYEKISMDNVPVDREGELWVPPSFREESAFGLEQ